MWDRFGEEVTLGPCLWVSAQAAQVLSSGLMGLCRCVGQREGGV